MHRLAALLALFLSSCSLGPALPLGVPVVNVNCTWNVMDGGRCNRCVCHVTNPTATSTPGTRGIETGDVDTRTRLGLALGAPTMDAGTAPADAGVPNDGGPVDAQLARYQ